HVSPVGSRDTNTVPEAAFSPMRRWMRCQPGGVRYEPSALPMPLRAVETGQAATAVSFSSSVASWRSTSVTSNRSGNEAGAPGRERSRCAKPKARAADSLSTDVVIARTLPYRASAPNLLVGVLTREGSGPARGRPALIDPSQATSNGDNRAASNSRSDTAGNSRSSRAVIPGTPIVAAIGVIAVAAIPIPVAGLLDWRSLIIRAVRLRQRGGVRGGGGIALRPSS